MNVTATHQLLSSGVSSMISTDILSIMSAQNQAIQVKNNFLKVAAAKAAAAKPPDNCKNDKQNVADIATTTTHPYKQGAVPHYTP